MEQSIQRSGRLRFNVHTALAYVYFFFNSVGLPFGLLYTTLLAPVFYISLVLKRRKPLILPYLLTIIPFDIIHIILGVDLNSFIISNILLLCTYLFTVSFREFIRNYPQEKLARIFRKILVFNFLMTIVAIAILFTPYREILWYVKKFTANVESLPRLALMTYEASYYSLMLVPIAFYYILKVFFRFNHTKPSYLLALVMIPLILSMSVGVLGAMVLAFCCLYYIHSDKILRKKSFFFPLAISLTILALLALILIFFFPDNPLFIRLQNILAGQDTSAYGRTYDSFTMGYRIANEKSLLFGAGLGQIKILAPVIVGKYYQYWGHLDVVRIPNTLGETLAMFGFAGLALRFLVIGYLFHKTRPFDNYYRCLLFCFVFIYQFTGSFITNIVEYIIWALAFTPGVFSMFDVKRKQA